MASQVILEDLDGLSRDVLLSRHVLHFVICEQPQTSRMSFSVFLRLLSPLIIQAHHAAVFICRHTPHHVSVAAALQSCGKGCSVWSRLAMRRRPRVNQDVMLRRTRLGCWS